MIFPARYCIYTALILRNEFVHLFEGAFRNLIYARSHLTPQNFQEICACFLAHIKSQIWDASSAHSSMSVAPKTSNKSKNGTFSDSQIAKSVLLNNVDFNREMSWQTCVHLKIVDFL